MYTVKVQRATDNYKKSNEILNFAKYTFKPQNIIIKQNNNWQNSQCLKVKKHNTISIILPGT